MNTETNQIITECEFCLGENRLDNSPQPETYTQVSYRYISDEHTSSGHACTGCVEFLLNHDDHIKDIQISKAQHAQDWISFTVQTVETKNKKGK